MKNQFTLFVIFLVFAVFFVYFFNSKKNKAELKIEEKTSFYEERIKAITILHNIQIKYIDNPINSKFKSINIYGESIDNRTNLNKLVLFIPESVCNLCYEGFFKDLDQLVETLGKENFRIFVPKNRISEILVDFKNNNSKLGSNIVGVNVEEINIQLGKKHVPFMFFLDEDYRLKNLFIPNKYLTNTIKQYLELIKNRYIISENEQFIER